MKRRSEENVVCQRQLAVFALFSKGHPFLKQPGRFRKRHALDCGKVHCNICHHNKYPKRELLRCEMQSNRDYREQLREMKLAS